MKGPKSMIFWIMAENKTQKQQCNTDTPSDVHKPIRKKEQQTHNAREKTQTCKHVGKSTEDDLSNIETRFARKTKPEHLALPKPQYRVTCRQTSTTIYIKYRAHIPSLDGKTSTPQLSLPCPPVNSHVCSEPHPLIIVWKCLMKSTITKSLAAVDTAPKTKENANIQRSCRKSCTGAVGRHLKRCLESLSAIYKIWTKTTSVSLLRTNYASFGAGINLPKPVDMPHRTTRMRNRQLMHVPTKTTRTDLHTRQHNSIDATTQSIWI